MAKNRPEREGQSRARPAAANTAKQKSHHARARVRTRAVAPPPLPDDQYLQNFFYWTLLRYPNTTEATYWNDILRAAYARGTESVILSVRELGQTLFESADYAARNRSDHDYVYDLYKTYLYREPDQAGWDYWTSVVPTNGRANVRRGFEFSVEFMNLCGTLTPNGGITSAVSSLSTARIDPFNQTGNQLRARDAEWAVSFLGLPGRAGLNLGLSLSYSSLVWTRSGPHIYFDQDTGWPSPGFRLGFPTIQEKSFDAQAGQNVFVMITPSGRVELRQVGTSTTYEAADSSYLQLIDNGGWLLVRSTDGTQFSYGWFNREWRCTQIKDRNGNYVSVNYDGWGHITTITDTLGRVINFVYDGNNNPACITQGWNGQPAPTTCGAAHTWATFGWSNLTMAASFPGLSVVGTFNGEVMPVLTQVGLDDGTRYNFEYSGAGQVIVIRSYRSDNVQRAYTIFDYTGIDDCPRLWQTRVWAENWTGLNGVPYEVTTQFSLPGDGSHQMSVVGDPNTTVYKEFYAGSAGAPPAPAWQRGLVLQSEVWSGGVRQKWTTSAWTQDNTGVNYQTNPRVTETNVYDASGNRRRTTIDYSVAAYVQYGLPYFVSEYAADGVTEIRRTYTDYNLSQAFLNQRIIGLVAATHLTDAGGYQAKITYSYDTTSLNPQATTATQHDPDFSSGFTARGNVTSISRWDVTDINNPSKALTTQMSYNAAGSVLATTDAAGHTNSISYGDSFSDGNNGRNTFAYPTTLTDADNFSSTVQYNFDYGAKTRTEGPPPAGQPQGAIQLFSYDDDAARLRQVTTQNTGAYTRFVYGSNYVLTFATVNNVADDSYSVQHFDGLGRVFATAGYHPGSTGGFKAQLTYYDQMGRAMMQSNPTEIYSNWAPAGDDAGPWVFTQQTYDWKGRPLRTVNQDNTFKEASYSGCGCAGGEVVTLTDEVGRQQKVYSDVLGRQWKSEILNWNGTVYSATATSFNARDQGTAVNSYKGAATSDLSCPSGTCMQSLTTYDGYGRVATRRLPQQTSAASYAYNADDTVQSVTDPRGVVATNTFNGRHLLTGISYSVPAGIAALAPVSFGYDPAGNRTSMSDGTGTASYAYDQLSRMTSETKTFAGLSNSYTINYGYNVSRLLTNITDPSGAQVSYNYDSAGQLSNMPASGYNGVTSFLSNMQYRASGAMKHATYGNGIQVNLSYNSRLQIGQYQVTGLYQWQGGPAVTIGATMNYYADGRTNTAFDSSDSRFDRKYEFDFSARLKEAYSGAEAQGAPPPPLNQANSPYRQSYTYDEWNNATLRTGRIWAVQNEYDSASYGSDNKRSGFGYDAAGNVTWANNDGERTYDAAGRPVTFTSAQNWQVWPDWPSGHPDGPALETQDTFDGAGQVVKHVHHTRDDDSYDMGGGNIVYWMSDSTTTTYSLHSTLLGGKTIAQLDQNGNKITGYVYAGGSRLATQTISGGSNWIQIEATNPVTGAAFTTSPDGYGVYRQEPDPLGRDLTNPPDPTVVTDPIASSKWNEPMPIEYSWGPSQGYLDANAAWDAEMAQQTWLYQTDYFKHKAEFINALIDLALTQDNQYYDKALQILSKNPNFFISIDGKWVAGQDAADAFAGAMANLPGDPLGLNSPKFAHASPQNTRRRMTDEEISDFRDQLQSTLTGDCKKFMDGVMANIPGAHNVMDVFNYMADHGKLSIEPGMQDSSGRAIRGAGGGNIVDGTASLTLNTGTGLISVILHELTHASGGAGSQYVSHYAMAQAAVSAVANAKIDLSKYQNGPTGKFWFKPWDLNVEGQDEHNSQVFQNILVHVCGNR